MPEKNNTISRNKTINRTSILCPLKISCQNKGKMKPFSDEHKRREFITSSPSSLQEMLKEVQAKGIWHCGMRENIFSICAHSWYTAPKTL